MLNKLNQSTVVSDEGYKVRFGHHNLEYTEGIQPNTIKIEIEDEISPHRVVIYFSHLPKTWENNSPITKIQEKQILERIIEAAKILKINYKIE